KCRIILSNAQASSGNFSFVHRLADASATPACQRGKRQCKQTQGTWLRNCRYKWRYIDKRIAPAHFIKSTRKMTRTTERKIAYGAVMGDKKIGVRHSNRSG